MKSALLLVLMMCAVSFCASAQVLPVQTGSATKLTVANSPVKIYQRTGFTTLLDGGKAVAISGTFTGNLQSLQYRVRVGNTVIVNWTAVGSLAKPTDTTYTATAWVPQGDAYKITVRDGNKTAVVSAEQSTTFGVGIRIAVLGQSLNYEMFRATPSRITPNAHLYRVSDGGGGTWSTPRVGDGDIRIGNDIRAALVALSARDTTPVAFLEYAGVGVDIASWHSGGASWAAFTDVKNGVNAPSILPDAEAASLHIGYADSFSDHSPATNFRPGLAKFLQQLLTLTGRTTSNFKLGIWTIGVVTAPVRGPTTITNDRFNIVNALLYAQAALPGCFFAGDTKDLMTLNGDIVHWDLPQYPRAGTRYARGFLKSWGVGTYGALGPTISSAVMPVGSTTITVSVTQNAGGTTLKDGLGFVSGTGLTGWVVTINGVPVAPRSIALSNGQIILTMLTARTDGQTVTLTYGLGSNPWNWLSNGLDNDNDLIYDDTTDLGDTLGRPLHPTYNGAVTVAAVGSGQRAP